MTTELQKQMDSILPGKTYPSQVDIVEKDGKTVKFQMQSYLTGMYCAIHFNGQLAGQGGHSNQKTFTRNLKKDIVSALNRGATVTIGSIANVKLTF
jgi:hypothetical protein